MTQAYKLVYLNSLIAISTDTTMSEEPGATAIAIAVNPKIKNTKRKRKRRTVRMKPWLCRIVPNNFKEFRQGSQSIFSRLCVLIMSRECFRVTPHSIDA